MMGVRMTAQIQSWAVDCRYLDSSRQCSAEDNLSRYIYVSPCDDKMNLHKTDNPMPAGIFMGQRAYTGVFPYLIFNGYYYRQIKDVTADFLASRKGQIALPHALNVADLYLCLFHSYCKKQGLDYSLGLQNEIKFQSRRCCYSSRTALMRPASHSATGFVTLTMRSPPTGLSTRASPAHSFKSVGALSAGQKEDT